MPAFVLPSFNLTAAIYTNGTYPGAPRLTTPCTLTPGERSMQAMNNAGALFQPSMFVWVPKLTDIRDLATAGGMDTIEIPAGTGRVYDVRMVDDVAKGHANEYRFAVLQKAVAQNWPVPIP